MDEPPEWNCHSLIFDHLVSLSKTASTLCRMFIAAERLKSAVQLNSAKVYRFDQEQGLSHDQVYICNSWERGKCTRYNRFYIFSEYFSIIRTTGVKSTKSTDPKGGEFNIIYCAKNGANKFMPYFGRGVI